MPEVTVIANVVSMVFTVVTSGIRVRSSFMRLPGLFILLVMLNAPHVGFAQPSKKVPIAVSHEGKDQVGQSVAHGLEEAIRSSQRFFLVAQNDPSPRITIFLESIQALAIPELRGQVSAIGISIVYYRSGLPGVGVFLGQAVNDCAPQIIQTCVKNILVYLERAADFLQQHDPDLWNTL